MNFKDTFITETYTKHCNSRHTRSLLAQSIMETWLIDVKTGVFKGLSENERICQFYPNQTVENVLVVFTLNSICNNVIRTCIDFLNVNDGEMDGERRQTSLIKLGWCMRTQKLYSKQ